MSRTTVSPALVLLFAALALPFTAGAAERQFTVANVDYEGTKLFVPATLIVHQGDKVRIKVLNNVPSEPSQHGFSIAEFGVQAAVTRGESAVVEFEATEAGLFPIKCHLHAAHVGGQLLVLPMQE